MFLLPGPAVAVPSGAADGQGAPQRDPLDRRRGRVQAGEPRDGGSALGHQEKQTKHELRKTQQGTQVKTHLSCYWMADPDP